jgi:UDP-glucuronate decarboxylase
LQLEKPQALQGEPITVDGDGLQTRSFCYVNDTIEAIPRFMETPESCTGLLNVGNPQEHTILDLAHRVIELIGSSSQVVFASLPTDAPQQRRPDIRRAKELLAWEPGTTINEGLAKTIRYFRGHPFLAHHNRGASWASIA